MRNLTDTGANVRLNLGCGDDVKSGYLNIDFRQTHPNVIQVDLSKFPWPFADRSAKEILMLDFLEHFPHARTAQILLECYRILQDDGEVVIQVPDAEHLCAAIAQNGPFLCNRCGASMHDVETSKTVGNHVTLEECPGCGQFREDVSEAAMMRLFGGQDYPGNWHQTCFTKTMLERKTYNAGLRFVRYEEQEHQYKNWNFKTVFKKGSVW